MVKIGYPDNWRDYSALSISPDDLIGNVDARQRTSISSATLMQAR